MQEGEGGGKCTQVEVNRKVFILHGRDRNMAYLSERRWN